MSFRAPLLAVALITPLSGCYGLYGNDEFARYAQRKDTVTLSAGDAKEVNARTHMNDAWPRYIGDRNIPMQGTRGVRAMECYRQAGGQQQVPGAQNQQTTNISSSSGSGAASAGGQSTQLRC